jgi:hypothetical protein
MSLSIAPLQLITFRRLLTAYTINATGDWLGQIALSLVVLRATGSVFAVGMLWTFCRFLPALIAPLLLDRAMRRGGRRLLYLAYAGEAIVFAAVAGAAALGLSVYLILALAAVDGLLAVTARSLTKAAIVCATRPVGLHREANALVNIAFTVSFAAGPALAGILVSVCGAASVLALDAVSFLGAAVALSRGLDIPTPHASDESPLANLRHIAAWLTTQKRLRTLLLADGAANVFFSMIIPVELVFVTSTLGAGPAAFGVVLAAWGLGAVLGSSLLVRLRGVGSGLLVSGSYAAMIASYLGMGSSLGIPEVIAFSFIGGIGNGIEGCAMLTAIQEQLPDQAQAKLNSLVEALRTAMPGVGFLLGGVIASVSSPRAAYFVAGLGALGVLAIVARPICTLRHDDREASREASLDEPAGQLEGVLQRA